MSSTQQSRRSQATFEPFVAMIYFVPEAAANYAELGLDRRMYYFCSRASAYGAVVGSVVAATFYNFNPQVVMPLVEGGWKIASPQVIGEARTKAVGAALQRLLAPAEGEEDLSGNIAPALELVRRATSNLPLAGRTLFAAYQQQTWPEEPLTALWWGMNLLREFRGDGHIAALLMEDVSGLESLLLQSAYKPLMPLANLLRSRAWPQEVVAAAQADFAKRDILRDGVLTPAGQQLRERIEENTDKMDKAPFETLGEAATDQLLALIQPLSARIVKNGGLGSRPAPKN